MTFSIVAGRAEVKSAYERLSGVLQRGAVLLERSVGDASGRKDYTVFWHSSAGFWAITDEWSVKGYGCCLGLETPENARGMNITCEMNVPEEGVNRKIGSLFLKSDDGALYMAHRGTLGGQSKGGGKLRFLQSFREEDLIHLEGEEHPVILIGMVEAPRFRTKVRSFLDQVQIFKKALKPNALSSKADGKGGPNDKDGPIDPGIAPHIGIGNAVPLADCNTNERVGVGRVDPITFRNRHNRMTGGLKRQFRADCLKTYNHPDCCCDVIIENYDGAGRDLLIEAKPDPDKDSVRTAIGQLFDYHRFLPRPDKTDMAILTISCPSESYIELLEQLGISILWYSDEACSHLYGQGVAWDALGKPETSSPADIVV